MKCLFAATAFAAALAQPASAVTFPTLTTIYVGTAVRDNQSVALSTAFICSNVSGVPATVRFLVLNPNGATAAQATVDIAHGATHSAITNGPTATFPANTNLTLGGQTIGQGTVNIESTQSAVFCSAFIVDKSDPGDGMPLHLVRVNPHPGTVE